MHNGDYNRHSGAEVKFLRELVGKLGKTRAEVVEVVKTIEAPYTEQNWYSKSYGAWRDGDSTNPVVDFSDFNNCD